MTETTPNTAPQAAPKSFEEALRALQQTVQKLESNETPLEESLKLYEVGQTLVKEAQAHLALVENKLEIIQRNAQAAEASETPGAAPNIPAPTAAETPQGGLF